MFPDRPELQALYVALGLPLIVLYLLALMNVFARYARPIGPRTLVSLRDAAVATIALDCAAIIDLVAHLGYQRHPVLIAVVAVAAFAHLVALQLLVRKFGESSDESPSAALARYESQYRSGFVVRLTSLYLAVLLLITNGTTLLAVLELVRTGK